MAFNIMVKRYREREMEAAIKESQDRGYELIVPTHYSKDYVEKCEAGKEKLYFPLDTFDTYIGYIAILRLIEDEEHGEN